MVTVRRSIVIIEMVAQLIGLRIKFIRRKSNSRLSVKLIKYTNYNNSLASQSLRQPLTTSGLLSTKVNRDIINIGISNNNNSAHGTPSSSDRLNYKISVALKSSTFFSNPGITKKIEQSCINFLQKKIKGECQTKISSTPKSSVSLLIRYQQKTPSSTTNTPISSSIFKNTSYNNMFSVNIYLKEKLKINKKI
ncbi:hypothetical protein ACTA71_005993 [Dictyostelium dimigraforme]